MTSQTGKQTIKIHTQPNISRSIDHRTMKFGQLIKYNMKNIFMKNNAQNLVEKLIPGPFLKIRIQHISGSTLWSSIQFVFIEDYQHILKAKCWHLFSLHMKLFPQSKRGLKLVFLAHFLHGFWRKIFIIFH